MEKRIGYIILVTILALNLVYGAQYYLRSAESAEKNDVYLNLRLFSQVLERVRQDYVDGDKLTYQDLIRSALKGMLDSLDPHSEFLEPEKYDDLKKETEGSFGGVGIQIGVRNDFITVIAPIDDTPASRAGILPGDRIIKIDGTSTEKMSLTEAVKRLRGTPGTEVTVTILRPSTGAIKDYKLTRADINLPTVKDINGKREFPLGDGQIGYVRLTQFTERTESELDDALAKLTKQGAKGLILDLRDNPGGLLDQAAKVCERFVPPGTLIVSTEGRSTSHHREYRASGKSKRTDLPMVVLVNGGSASASEIVAGCLQDLKRAVVVGEQTFGKGSVQSVIALQDGAALRLTTAKYYTPSHRVIHEQGIVPDIIVPVSPEDTEALFILRTPGLVETLDPERQERIRRVRDVQLERATDLLKGITIYTSRAKTTGKTRSEGVTGKGTN
ncbi:MAG: S41 family peptidase [Verrucomicrobiae bacterium]|nr:S41 family peptidase [Verrucomicrobiae bacterium]